MKYTKEEKQKAAEALARIVQKGDTVYTVLKHVSKSGMVRDLDLYVIRDNTPLRLTWSAAILTDHPYHKGNEGLRVSGCGMDMGFHAVYSLACEMFQDGYALNHRWM